MLSNIKRAFCLLVVALAMAFIVPCGAHAQTYYSTTTGTLGDQNSSKDYRVFTTTDGVVHYASDTGILSPYATVQTTNFTLTAAQTGTTQVINASVSGVQATLPTAAVGMQYTIIADNAKWFYVKPQSTDTIKFASTAAGVRLSNSSTAAAGDSITLFCAVANTWSVKNRVGTWAAAGQ